MADFTLSFTGEEIDARLAAAGRADEGAGSDISGLLCGENGSLRAAVPDQDYLPAFPQFVSATTQYVYPEQFPINSVILLKGYEQIVLLTSKKDGEDYPIGATYTFVSDGPNTKRFAGNGAGISAKYDYRYMDVRNSVVKAIFKGNGYWILYGDLVEAALAGEEG